MQLWNAETTGKVLTCAIEVHRTLGPGLLEKAYRECLVTELQAAQLSVERETRIRLSYKGAELDCGFCRSAF